MREGEEVVGVYGVKDSKQWLTSLGFILMRKIPADAASRASHLSQSEDDLADLKISASETVVNP